MLLLARSSAPAIAQQRGRAAVEKLCARHSNVSEMASSSSGGAAQQQEGGPPSPAAAIDFLMLLQNLKVGRAVLASCRGEQDAL